MENGKKPRKDIKMAYRTSYLIAAYIKGTLTDIEKSELDAWIDENRHNKDLFKELTDEDNVARMLADYSQTDPEQYLQKSKQDMIFRGRRRTIRAWSYAAACIVALIALLFVTKPFSKKADTPGIVDVNNGDIMPGSEQATLLLADGRKISLLPSQKDSIVNSQITIHPLQGELVYEDNSEIVEYHTLTIPRKGFYSLYLPDGTTVILNAESSIRFPTAFNGDERRVYVTGETFFKVAENKSKPFRVDVNGTIVEALGTEFNISAYADEPSLTASLLEGSVQVRLDNGKETILAPGQQAIIKNEEMRVVSKDLEFETAWTRNQFKFTNTPLPAIMRSIARWYDADIVYQDNVNTEFNATIDRNVPVSRLLYLLSKTEEVHFKIEGKKIIVTK